MFKNITQNLLNVYMHQNKARSRHNFKKAHRIYKYTYYCESRNKRKTRECVREGENNYSLSSSITNLFINKLKITSICIICIYI
jgi:hypothetical protein